MGIKLFFGLPGAGKTTMLAKIAYDTSLWMQGKGLRSKLKPCPYKHIYGNIPLKGIPGYQQIRFDYLGRYDTSNSLILIDEATIEVDSRDYKSFKPTTKQFFLLHRHYNCDLCLFTQQNDGVDKKIRVITDRVYYLYKGFFTGSIFTRYYRVPYGIIIPDHKKSDTEKLGEIIQGYCKPSLLSRILTPPILRSKYYKFFDSWDAPKLPPLPAPRSAERKAGDQSADPDPQIRRFDSRSGEEKQTKA